MKTGWYVLLCVVFFASNLFAVTLDFEDVEFNFKVYEFDADGDLKSDIKFTCEINFTDDGPGTAPQLYTNGKGLMPANKLLRVDFLNTAVKNLAFGYALDCTFDPGDPHGMTVDSGVRFDIYNQDGILLSTEENYGQQFSVPPDKSSHFAENQINISFEGVADYGIITFIDGLDASVYFIDNFTGLFGSTELEEIEKEIEKLTAIAPRAKVDETQGVARAFDNSTDTDLGAVKSELLAQTNEALNAALGRIKGRDKPTLVHVATSATQGHMGTVSSRMSSSGVRGSLSGIDFVNTFSSLSTRYDDKEVEGKNNFTLGYGAQTGLNGFLPWGAWVRGYGSKGNMDATNITSGYEHQTTGLSLGFDYRINENFLVGMHGGYSDTDVDYSTSDYSDIESHYYGVYTGYTISRLAIDLMLTYARSSYETTRFINVGAINREARGDFDGEEFSAYAEMSYCFELDETTSIRPLIGFQSSYNIQDGYSETGADSLNLILDQDRVASYKVSLGAEYATKLTGTDNFKLDLLIRGRWLYELGDAVTSTTAALSGARNDTFTIKGSELNRNTGIIGTSVSMKLPNANELELGYDYTLNADYDSHTVSFGYKLKW